jgi:hypothetical protein
VESRPRQRGALLVLAAGNDSARRSSRLKRRSRRTADSMIRL